MVFYVDGIDGDFTVAVALLALHNGGTSNRVVLALSDAPQLVGAALHWMLTNDESSITLKDLRGQVRWSEDLDVEEEALRAHVSALVLNPCLRLALDHSPTEMQPILRVDIPEPVGPEIQGGT